MPFRHLIRFAPDGSSQWLALDRNGRVLAGPLTGLPTAQAEEVVVLLPAETVTLLPAPRVAKQWRQLEQAVPFAIEESLTVPVEQCRVAIADTGLPEQVTAAVIGNARLAGFVEVLDAAGIAPDRIIPESWLLPVSEAEATLLLDGSRAVLRHAQAGALAGDTNDELSQWLEWLVPKWPAERQLTCVGDAAALSDQRLEGTGIALRRESVDWSLVYLAKRLGQAPELNLLGGAFAPRKTGRASALWRIAAIVSGVAVLLLFAQTVLETTQLKRRHATQRLEMEAELRQALPGVSRIVDPKAQLLGELSRRQGAGGEGVLTMLAAIAPVISGSGRYTLDGMEFRGGTLDITLRTDAVATLDSLRETLAALPGFAVELIAVTPGGGGVEGKLRLRRSGA